MITQQPLYLLAGGRGHSIMVTMMNVRNIINSIGKEKPEIAFVGAASMRDNWLIYALISMFIKVGCKCTIRRVLLAAKNADIEKAKAQLQKADVVLLSGGDVDVGMQILEEKQIVGFIQALAKQGKILIGISAGAIMMGRNWVRWSDPKNDSTAAVFPCLGLVPFICDTHAEGDDWAELKMSLQLEQPGITGYGISSGAYLKAYPDGKLEAEMGYSAKYTLLNGKVARLPDLMPYA
jgi:peptidase E